MRELYNEFFHIPKDGKIREKAMLARTAITVVIMIVCLAAMSVTAYAYFSYNVTSGSSIIKTANFEVDIIIEEKGVVPPKVVESTVKSVSQGDAIESVVLSATQKQMAEQTTESVPKEDETITKSVSQGDALDSKDVQVELTDRTANPIADQTLQANLTEMANKLVTEEGSVEPTVISRKTVNCSKEYSLIMEGGNVYTITLKKSNSSTATTGFVIITAVDCDSRYHTQQIGIGDGNMESLTFNIKPDGDTTVTFTSHWGTSPEYDDYKTKGVNDELYITQDEKIMLSINGAEEQRKIDLTIPAKDSKGSTEETMESKLPEISTTTKQTGLEKTVEQASTKEEQESSEIIASTESTPAETPDMSETIETTSLETPETQESTASTEQMEPADETVTTLSEEIQDTSEATAEVAAEAG